MAMSIPQMGMNRFMKDGTRHLKGIEEAVQRNIEACKDLAATTRSCYGPKGMSKMVINHIEKLFVTNDAATILNELSVEHPAAKMLVMASQMQEQEIGDGTNAVIILAASLLEHASDLINLGLKPVEITEGYERALDVALKALDDNVVEDIDDVRQADRVKKVVRAAIMSKQYGNEDLLAELTTSACLSVIPAATLSFNVDNVRVTKMLGAALTASTVMNGMLFKRGAEGDVKSATKAAIACYTCPFDITQTETKGTVLMNTADELKSFAKGEESEIEAQVDAIVAAGVTCVVAGGKFGDLYLHHLNARGIMAVRLTSKFDLRRLCASIGATAQTQIAPPPPDAIGHCDEVAMDEIGETEVVVFRQSSERGRVATVVLRGSSDSMLDDMQRAIDDGVNTVKALSKSGKCVAGGGAVEIEMSRAVDAAANACAGIEQYAIRQFALALEALPKQIADNAGIKSSETLAKVVAAHGKGAKTACVNIAAQDSVGDAVQLGVLDLHALKASALRLAVNAANTVLLVDQIIMAKPAGAGPKPRGGPRAMDANDDA